MKLWFWVFLTLAFYTYLHALDVSHARTGENMKETHLGVILSARDTADAAKKYKFLGLSGPYWTPSLGDIARLEEKLPGFVEAAFSQRDKGLHPSLAEYRRQYFGITDSGQHAILVNAFCKAYWSEKPEWRTKVIAVLDGGKCFFRVRFNVRSEAFSGFEVNAES